MRKVSFLLIFILSILVVSGDKSYAQTSNNDLLSEEVWSSFTEEELAKAYEEIFVNNNTDNLTQEELDALAVIILNDIYNGRTSDSNNITPLGADSSLPSAYSRLNTAERALAKSHPAQAVIYYNCTKVAEGLVSKNFIAYESDHTNANAYKHSIWSACLSREMGVTSTKKWTDAHETVSATYISGQMDYANNKSGRDAFTKLYNDNLILKPTYNQLSDYLLERIKNGHLVRLNSARTLMVSTDGTGRK